eukprot:CAMPEP_0202341696 /NCGR_PEP_ID=MMETSP1126-20121109/2576_1 /ASSEMBLY_ACC=CAM_ASM_000457 /TAXON_ID=3047 /ORGANISM="Dunaliella tertiolecta, Strain CCMP1320" /LENGTH=343 /DNA_ID=CAMNT_0048932541 /DNA_START=87 /DNA_END=1118 /DNA_ORIENTATION=+
MITAAVVAVLLLLGMQAHAAPLSATSALSQLRQLRDSSPDRVISLDDAQFAKFGRSVGREFSLIVFLTAHQMSERPQLKLGDLRKEFGYAAQALLAGPDPDAAFFAEMVFEDSPKVFHALGANQVPFIFRVDPAFKVSMQSMVIPKTDRMNIDTVRAKYPWTAEVIVEFFSTPRAGRQQLQFGQVDRPSFLKSPWFPYVAAGAVAGAIGLVYLLWRTIARHPAFWAVGAVGVFWFSVSGGMYNIIRGMPLFLKDKQGKMQLFTGSRSGQLGAEGFIVGSGYVLFSLSVALLTHGMPHVKNSVIRGSLSYILVALAGFLAVQIWQVYTSKTGYKVSSYLLDADF